ncbi:MAG: hypothetical protein H7296_12520 [Bacteroidia bacterium]|nr:hypothetical protein [Bacteroidia bacterium]
MKIHTTNYIDTFIEIAIDCPTTIGEIPPLKGEKKTAANIQFEMLYKNPYKYTSDDILFQVFADKNEIIKSGYMKARELFFSKGQPCFRASPLTKRYGWGVHNSREGKMAIYGAESAAYKQFLKDSTLKVVKAMKASK